MFIVRSGHRWLALVGFEMQAHVFALLSREVFARSTKFLMGALGGIAESGLGRHISRFKGCLMIGFQQVSNVHGCS